MKILNKNSFRVFSNYEYELFNNNCRSFLITLEQQSIFNPYTRDLVINKAIELASKGIDLSLLKLITLMVPLNQSYEKQSLAIMELLVFDDTLGGIH
nr:DUF494 family protein [Coxiella-like endosymbiont]